MLPKGAARIVCVGLTLRIGSLIYTGLKLGRKHLISLKMASELDNGNARREFLAASCPSEFLATWLGRAGLLSPEERQTFQSYYCNFGTLASERMRWAYDRQLEEVTDVIRASPGQNVLEVGCGCGTESLWFAFNGADVTSIDIKTDRLATARSRQKILERMLDRKLKCQFIEQNLLEMEGQDRFDIVWVQQTFHHLEPRADCVAALSRLIRPGGKLIVSEVNAWNPLIQGLLFRRRGFRTICDYEDERGCKVIYGNERILTASRLRRWFTDAGLNHRRSTYYRVFPSNRIFDTFSWLERKISGSMLVPLQTHYNFVASKPARGVARRRHK